MKSYGHFCALARALDVVGDRWALLVVRELLVRPSTFGELQQGLPGIATNVLTERLRHLEDDEIVWRRREGRTVTYGLSRRGADLTDLVHALIRWGAPEMQRGAGDDAVRGQWLRVALEGLTRPSSAVGLLGFHVDDEVIVLDVSTGTVTLDEAIGPDVEIATDVEGVLALASGQRALSELLASGAAHCSQPQKADRLLGAVVASTQGEA